MEARAFGREKHEVAQAGDLLSFGRFHKSARFFIDYHSELVLQTARGISRGFKNTRWPGVGKARALSSCF